MADVGVNSEEERRRNNERRKMEEESVESFMDFSSPFSLSF